MAVRPNQNEVRIHGFSHSFWVLVDRCTFSWLNRAWCSCWGHSRKCQWSLFSRWHDGQRRELWWGEPWMHIGITCHWWKESVIVDCYVQRSEEIFEGQTSEPGEGCPCVQWCFFFRYTPYEGKDIVWASIGLNLQHLFFPSIHRFGCAVGMAGLLKDVLSCRVDVTYFLQLNHSQHWVVP